MRGGGRGRGVGGEGRDGGQILGSDTDRASSEALTSDNSFTAFWAHTKSKLSAFGCFSFVLKVHICRIFDRARGSGRLPQTPPLPVPIPHFRESCEF